jgi:hypothetical protein
MRLIIDKSYIRDVRHVNHTTQIQAAEALESILDAQTFSDIPHLKPLKGQQRHIEFDWAITASDCIGTARLFSLKELAEEAIFIKLIRLNKIIKY